MPEPESERGFQQRWAEGAWPAPILHDEARRPLRIIHAGRWNFGPGPDFRQAQLLDADGRARRGDIELHLRPSGWTQHGHQHDPAYAEVMLHVVARNRAERGPDDPDLVTIELPEGASSVPAPAPPCSIVLERAGRNAVEAQLLQIAQRRFMRKTTEITQLQPPRGPGSADDRRAALAAARALGQPDNAGAMEDAMGAALAAGSGWDALGPAIGAALGGAAWRPGRGALGSVRTAGLVVAELLSRWRTSDGGPAAAFERLAQLPPGEAVAELRIPRRLGASRARQLLADAIYPFNYGFEAWSQLPGGRYRRTDALRERLEPDSERADDGVRWRHPQTQALLELERQRCRHGACAACPLARLARSSGVAGGGLVPSLNR